jgi:predicted alpha/beta-fold hydrolase
MYALRAGLRPRVDYRRERWEIPDGDFVDVDWLNEDSGSGVRDSARKALVVLFHGLEGGSGSQYSQALMAETARSGCRGAVVHFRGCSGAANRLPRAYHSGDSAELDWILHRFVAEHGAPVYAVGVSLGGNVLLKWLGEQSSTATAVVERAAAVSVPIDLMATGDALARGFNLVYTHAFLSTLKRKSLAKLQFHPQLYDAARVRRARTLREFDDLVTAPLHGFRDTDDYWMRASAKPWLACIAVPTLLLNARNDPFLTEESLPDAHAVSTAVTLELPQEGGHVGFVSGPFPGNLSWLPGRILEFFGLRRG